MPLGIPLNLIVTIIASGYVDAIAYGWDSTTTTKGVAGNTLADQLKVVVDARLAAPALMIVMNRATWDSDARRSQEDRRETRRRSRDGQRAHSRGRRKPSRKKKMQNDPRFTALTFSDEQRAELQARHRAGDRGMEGQHGQARHRRRAASTARARELIQQYKVAAK